MGQFSKVLGFLGKFDGFEKWIKLQVENGFEWRELDEVFCSWRKHKIGSIVRDLLSHKTLKKIVISPFTIHW